MLAAGERNPKASAFEPKAAATSVIAALVPEMVLGVRLLPAGELLLEEEFDRLPVGVRIFVAIGTPGRFLSWSTTACGLLWRTRVWSLHAGIGEVQQRKVRGTLWTWALLEVELFRLFASGGVGGPDSEMCPQVGGQENNGFNIRDKAMPGIPSTTGAGGHSGARV